MVIYKLDGSKKMEMSEEEALAVHTLWVMYGNSRRDSAKIFHSDTG